MFIEEYQTRTSTSKRLYDRAYQILPGGYARGPFLHFPYPTFMKRAKGCKIWDVDGNEYIDFLNNYGPLILGHNDPVVVDAVKQQLETLWEGGPSEPEVELAEQIKKPFPWVEKVLFCPTGSEACMKAVRTYRVMSGKDTIVMCEGAYHGSSDSLIVPPVGIPKELAAKTIFMPFNDIEGSENVIKRHRKEIAAVLLEPTLGPMGHEPANPEFYKALRELTKALDVPLIFDEIVDGFRIATGGAQERFGVKADMTILGKIIGGGFPIGAFASFDDTMEIYSVAKSGDLDSVGPRLSHIGTFNDFKPTMAAGLATLKQLTEEKYEQMERIGNSLRDGLRKICSDLGIRAQVTGVSSIFHLQFVGEPITSIESARRANKALYRNFELSMFNKGINLGKDHCSFCSTPMTEDEVKLTLQAAEQTLTAIKPLVREEAPSLLE